MLRPETKVRARALQVLYAWEMQGRPTVSAVAENILRCSGGRTYGGEGSDGLATMVAARSEHLDTEIAEAAEFWRLSRIGVIERNILRLGLHELLEEQVPPRVVIDEAVRLAHWFAGIKAPAFVNGVLDALARRHGRL